jgi:hypothetical protein
MRTTIDLSDDLYRRAKATAALRGIKFKELVAQSLETILLRPVNESSDKRRERTPLPPPVRPPTGRPIPALTNAEIEAILTLEDAKLCD